MGWLHRLFEPEESVGTAWHKAAERLAGDRRFPAAAVRFDDVRGALAVLFRGLGAGGGVELRPLSAEASGHRLGLSKRVATDAERIAGATFDGVVLGLPSEIDVFPERRRNADLYLWLVAFCACARPAPPLPSDPLRGDLARLAHIRAEVAHTLAVCPGLRGLYRTLAGALLDGRRTAALPPVEADVEKAVRAMLAAAAARVPDDPGSYFRHLSCDEAASGAPEAPLDYKPFLPVAAWPTFATRALGSAAKRAPDDEQPGSGSADGGDERKKAERRRGDQADRKDGLLLHRFEHILSWAEFLNINRTVDDDDEENARRIADDADKVSVVTNRKKAATRLRFDLDLAPEDVEIEALSGTSLYPEWDHRRGSYLRDHCRVLTSMADPSAAMGVRDPVSQRRIAAVRRRFEALRPKRTSLPNQIDGDEIDIEAAVRAAVDVRACGEGSDRIWRRSTTDERDLAVFLLVDTSRSTESACGRRTVIEIAREAVIALTEGVAACGDDIAVASFSSLRRDRVYVRIVKDFDEPVDDGVRARIAGLKPGFYTRIGPALRHATNGLSARPNRKRLLIVLTDGKPNDLDHYQGRYGIEDTRRAVMEARRKGLAVFGITVDAKARSYFPYIFGAGGYAIVSRPEKLAEALPVIWQHLVDA